MKNKCFSSRIWARDMPCRDKTLIPATEKLQETISGAGGTSLFTSLFTEGINHSATTHKGTRHFMSLFKMEQSWSLEEQNDKVHKIQTKWHIKQGHIPAKKNYIQHHSRTSRFLWFYEKQSFPQKLEVPLLLDHIHLNWHGYGIMNTSQFQQLAKGYKSRETSANSITLLFLLQCSAWHLQNVCLNRLQEPPSGESPARGHTMDQKGIVLESSLVTPKGCELNWHLKQGVGDLCVISGRSH